MTDTPTTQAAAVTQADRQAGYREAEAMLCDLLTRELISDTAIRVARDHMMSFARHRLSAAPAGVGERWRERWYGSEPDRGSAITDERGNLIAYFGGDEETHKAVTAIVQAHNTALVTPRSPAGVVRITRDEYPEIIQAARWMDDDHGTPHFEPGVGFVVDDPEGLSVPVRWVPHLPKIEAALAGLDHANPHPLDVDTFGYLAREGKAPALHDSAVYCFVSGEHTPVTAMATSSPELWTAHTFFNERFEGWEFDPTAGYPAASPAGESALREALPSVGGRENVMGVFGHHHDPRADYEAEVRALVQMAYDRLTTGGEPDLEERIAKAMEWRTLDTLCELRWLNKTFRHRREIYTRKPDWIEWPEDKLAELGNSFAKEARDV